MGYYEKVITHAPIGNDDAILRWNTCACLIMKNPQIHPSSEDDEQAWLRDRAGSRIADA